MPKNKKQSQELFTTKNFAYMLLGALALAVVAALSANGSMLTGNLTGGSGLATPTVTTACNGAVPTATLSWTAAGTEATAGYRINVAATPSFSQPRYVKYISHNLFITTYPDGFDPQPVSTSGATYYARVISGATGDISNTTSFTIPSCLGGGGTHLTAVCGNGTCDAGETAASCASDCGTSGGVINPVCGNGICESGETTTSCASDCTTGGQNGTSSVDLTVNDANTVVWTSADTDKVHLRWKSTGTTSCTYNIDKGAAKSVDLIGSANVTPGSGNHTITMMCNGSAGSVTDSVRTEQHKRTITNALASTASKAVVGTVGSGIGTVSKMASSGTISVDPVETYIPGTTDPGEEYRVSNAYVEGTALDPRIPRVAVSPFYRPVFFYVTSAPNQLPTYEGRSVCGDKSNFVTDANLPGIVPGFEGSNYGFKTRIPAAYLDGAQHYLSACMALGGGLSDVPAYYLGDTTFFMKDAPFKLTATTDLKVSTDLLPNNGGPNKQIYATHGNFSDGPLTVSFDPQRGEGAVVEFKWVSPAATSCIISSPDTGSVITVVRQGMTGTEGTSYENFISGYGTHRYVLKCTDAFGTVTSDEVDVNGPQEQAAMVDVKVIAPESTEKVDGPITVGKNDWMTKGDFRLVWTTRHEMTSCTGNFTGGGSANNVTGVPVRADKTTTYTVTCTGPGGATGIDSVTVNVTP